MRQTWKNRQNFSDVTDVRWFSSTVYTSADENITYTLLIPLMTYFIPWAADGAPSERNLPTGNLKKKRIHLTFARSEKKPEMQNREQDRREGGLDVVRGGLKGK